MIKDIVLVAAGMVIAAGTFRRGRMIREEPAEPASDALVRTAAGS